MSDLTARPARIDWLEQDAGDVPDDDAWLSPFERRHLAGFQVAKRRIDWRSGRWTAKLAAATAAGLSAESDTLCKLEVRPLPSGAPCMFRFGEPMDLALSITHRDGRAACAVSASGVALGCDLEVAEPRSAAFISDYLSERERSEIRAAGAACPWLATLYWSAKESTLKALGLGLTVDTCRLEVRLGGPSSADEGSGTWNPLSLLCDGRTFDGWWQREQRWLRTLVAWPAPLPPAFARPLPASLTTAAR